MLIEEMPVREALESLESVLKQAPVSIDPQYDSWTPVSIAVQEMNKSAEILNYILTIFSSPPPWMLALPSIDDPSFISEWTERVILDLEVQEAAGGIGIEKQRLFHKVREVLQSVFALTSPLVIEVVELSLLPGSFVPSSALSILLLARSTSPL
jgi:hypothetical protein